MWSPIFRFLFPLSFSFVFVGFCIPSFFLFCHFSRLFQLLNKYLTCMSPTGFLLRCTRIFPILRYFIPYFGFRWSSHGWSVRIVSCSSFFSGLRWWRVQVPRVRSPIIMSRRTAIRNLIMVEIPMVLSLLRCCFPSRTFCFGTKLRTKADSPGIVQLLETATPTSQTATVKPRSKKSTSKWPWPFGCRSFRVEEWKWQSS